MDTRNFLMPDEIRVLGGVEYIIERVIGYGASTVVYEASYMDELNKDYAHKVLIKELYPYDEKSLIYRDQDGILKWDSSKNKLMEDHKYFFRRGNEMNIRLLAKNPKSVSGNANSFEAYGTYYSVLPLHGGKTLEAYLKEKTKLSLMEASNILTQTLDALSPFHENGMLNLDISPDNILILDDRCMFIDYNSVWDLNDTKSDCFLSQKEGYTAPEIMLQEFEDIGYGSDLYSITAVFYQMLIGERFFLNNKGWEKIPAMVAEKVTEELTPEVKKEIVKILKQGLHPLAEKRFKTVLDYQNKVNELITKLENKEGKERALKVKFFGWGVAGLTLILAAGFGGKYAYEEKPWLPRIISQGNTNANIYNKARFCEAKDQYQYYIDVDGNLVASAYDETSKSFDPVNASVFVSQNDQQDRDGVDFLNLGTDAEGNANKLYYCYYGGIGNADSVRCINLDGSDPEVLFTQEDIEVGDYYTYARLSNDKEYIYYMVGPEVQSEEGYEGYADDYAVWRYDINKKESELLIDTSVQWFNVYDKYIYYIEYDYDAHAYHLLKANLDGTGSKLLDADNQFIRGFVQDDRLYLERYLDEEYCIKSCDLNGKILNAQEGVYALDLNDVEIGYDDGWIYYCVQGDEELRKVRLNGTADKLIYSGLNCYGINCVGSSLFLAVSEPVEDVFLSNDDILEDYIIDRNGESCIKVK